ncbi:MAG: hypothetical protein ACKPKO_37170 [Candidatus Fonsibacter sp.]
MSQRQFLRHVQRDQQIGTSSSSGQQPIYNPAQPQVHTGVPAFALDSFSEQQMTPKK